MECAKIAETIQHVIALRPDDVGAYADLFALSREWEKSDSREAHKLNRTIVREKAAERLKHGRPEDASLFYDLYRRSLLFDAPVDFDAYMLYIEQDRVPKDRFYAPRRRVLHSLANDIQSLLQDDELDLLTISLPPGVGKTTLAIFALTWLAGKWPNEPSLSGSHSNSFIRGVYDECLRIFDRNGEYLWHDVFPTINVSSTNAKDCRIDLDKRQRFETLEFTSIGTGNAGLYRAKKLLYCDDLISGLEVALNKERLDKLWDIYTTDLRQRKIGDHCKELHIATRWSVYDVIGRLEREYEGNPRAKFVKLPALNDEGESNFDYAYGVGFSTEVYHEQRDIMDDISWRALYQNEPIEREGLLYHPDEMRRYFSLPDKEPDAIIAVCDTKDEGKDYAVMPVGYVYGEDYYIDDVVCDNGLPGVVDIRLTDILVRNKVQQCRFESNSAGGRTARDINKMVEERHGITHITSKFTTSNKETKIIVNSDWVKKHCLFKDKSCFLEKSDYGKFMKMLFGYTLAGKNSHDDVPDAMAMFALFAQNIIGGRVEIFDRPC